MLQIPQLDDITFEQLLQGAIHKIPMLTDEWTDLNHHDPGITTLEVYTWLIDMLHTYMSATGKVHLLKYMKLLGVEELPGKAAEAWVCLEIDREKGQDSQEVKREIPLGLPIYAGSKCFLCSEAVHISDNRFQRLIYQGRNGVTDLTAFAGEDGSYAGVLEGRGEGMQQEAVYFGFEKPLTGEIRLFITVKENLNGQDLPRDFYLTKLNFYSYDGYGWKAVTILSDETNGLLKSGVLTLRLEQSIEAYQEDSIPRGYYLKAVPEVNCYDIPPEIGKCFLNPVKVIQKEELYSTVSLDIRREQDRYEIPYYMSEEDRITVAVWEEEKQAYHILTSPETSLNEGCQMDYAKREVVFSRGRLPAEGTQMEILLVEKEFERERELGSTDGCAGQELELTLSNTYELELLLEFEEKGERYYTHWNQIGELEKAGFEDRVFYFDKEKNCIRFGDGIHGRVPDRGCMVKVRYCSVSNYEEGNVRAGEIRLIKDKNYSKVKAFNTAMATGGRAEDTLERMQERFEQRVLEQNRIVSPGDYEKRVKEIPGLMVRGARIVAAWEYCRNHGLTYKPYDVYLVVCPDRMKHGDRLSPKYQEYIGDYLEKYRMLNTRVKIVPPAYGCVNVSGSICILGSVRAAKAEIELFLKSYLEEKERNCEFGAVISYGDIFIKLERLPSVERVEELHLSLGGEMGRKADKGDILLNSDCLPFLGEVEFEYKE